MISKLLSRKKIWFNASYHFKKYSDELEPIVEELIEKNFLQKDEIILQDLLSGILNGDQVRLEPFALLL